MQSDPTRARTIEVRRTTYSKGSRSGWAKRNVTNQLEIAPGNALKGFKQKREIEMSGKEVAVFESTPHALR
jgi:hypothetical protein